MSNEAPKKAGSQSAAELFLSAGHFLSMWEATEDQLLKIFQLLAEKDSDLIVEMYVESARAKRSQLLRRIAGNSESALKSDQQDLLKADLKLLDSLAQKRNQIAHGFVSKIHHSRQNVVELDGFYLTTSLDLKGNGVIRSFKYVYSADDINQVAEQVRQTRSRLIDLYIALQHQLHPKAAIEGA